MPQPIQLVYNVNNPQLLPPLLSMDTLDQPLPEIGSDMVVKPMLNPLLNISTILLKEDQPEMSLKCLSPSLMVPSIIFEIKMVVSVVVLLPVAVLI